MNDRRRLAERLHRAALLGRWSEVRAVADQLRGLGKTRGADKFGVAETRWWQAGRWRWPIGGEKDRIMNYSASEKSDKSEDSRHESFNVGERVPANRLPVNGGNSVAGDRFVLWIDAVGGFLICLADEVVLGQASPEGKADVAIHADLARRHAIIRRDGEGYWLEPLRPKQVRVDGQLIDGPTTLSDGRVLELGEGVKLRFRRPHPLSTTARLEPASFHRTQPTTDGVLLMADACIIGPHPQSHILAPEVEGEVVLFRQAGSNSLACRGPGELEIDGVAHRRRGPLAGHSRVVGETFSFTVETLVR